MKNTITPAAPVNEKWSVGATSLTDGKINILGPVRDTGMVKAQVFIYGDLDKGTATANEIVIRYNFHDELVEALKNVNLQLEVFLDEQVTNKESMNKAFQSARTLLSNLASK